MKNTFGKLGIGVAGAIACAALLSAGVQTANAQIVLTTSSPVETFGLVSGTYNFTYYLQFGDANTILESSGSYPASISLSLNGAASDLYTTPIITIIDSGINSAGGSFGGINGVSSNDTTTDGGNYIWDYNGGS